MKKKTAVIFPLIALLLTSCNPLDAVKNIFNRKQKEPETQEQDKPEPTPQPEPQPEPEPQPQPQPEPDPEPVPFTFDQFEYELKEGVDRSEIEGNPWINSNLEGQLDKIEKPSLKDDFYTAVNYDAIKNHELGIFDKSEMAVRDAFNSIYDENSKAENSALLIKVKNSILDGSCEEISSYFADFNYTSYVNSESLFVSPHSFFTIEKDDENNYNIYFNDGYVVGATSFATLSLDSRVDELKKNIASELCDIFNLSLTSENLESVYSFDYDSTSASFYSYYYSGGYNKSKYVFNTSKTRFLDNALTDLGLTDEDNIYINDATIEALKIFKNYNSETIQNALIMRLAFEYRLLAGKENYAKIGGYASQTGWFPGEYDMTGQPDDKIARSMTKLLMPDAIEKAYLDIEGKPERKALVTNVIERVIDTYKSMADTYDWLDATTKQGLYKKMDNMKYESCYSDKQKSYPMISEKNLELLGLLTLYRRYQSWVFDLKFKGLFETSEIWAGTPSYTVNAFYSPYLNAFCILNGVVSGIPNDGKIEQILGSIGVIVGHEISHSIDSTGAYFDENGEYNNWWSNSSWKKFENKVNNLVDFYNNIGVTNTVKAKGNNVDGEATADMGGVHVCLEIAKTIENFDYDLFFRTYANLWLTSPYRSDQIAKRNSDTHPFEYLRVNATLSQFDEFFETYNIKYGDKMYIPEDQRVAIW